MSISYVFGFPSIAFRSKNVKKAPPGGTKSVVTLSAPWRIIPKLLKMCFSGFYGVPCKKSKRIHCSPIKSHNNLLHGSDRIAAVRSIPLKIVGVSKL